MSLQSIVMLTLLMLVLTPVKAHEVIGESDENIKYSRYKIFTAEHEAVAKGGKAVKIQSIFKIDLETGAVWRYRQGIDQKGKTYEEFFEVPNQ
ncbi:MAG: hypothetical protein GXP08_18150 [Gammaproteobacteria bacterium]|nr:hypothetical protein [Gammaproteobacteria bacterium]